MGHEFAIFTVVIHNFPQISKDSLLKGDFNIHTNELIIYLIDQEIVILKFLSKFIDVVFIFCRMVQLQLFKLCMQDRPILRSLWDHCTSADVGMNACLSTL